MCIYSETLSGAGSCQQELRPDNRVPLAVVSGTATLVGVNVTAMYSDQCGALDPPPKACPDDFCLNGGACESRKGTLVCNCPDQYNYGPRCELLTARLQKGFAWFDALGTCELPTLHLTFQSDDQSALLLYNGPLVAVRSDYYPDDFLYLVLKNWVVEAYLNLGSGVGSVSVPVNRSAETAYDVYLTWSRNSIEMEIPNCGRNSSEATDACRSSESLPKSTTAILNAAGPLQLGGLDPDFDLEAIEAFYKWHFDLPKVDPFSGCVLMLKYNNVIYDLNGTTYNHNYQPLCTDPGVVTRRIAMSSESVFIIVGSLLLLLRKSFQQPF